MGKIKVGEYIRTKKKGIFRVLSINKTAYGYLYGTTDNEHIPTFTIGKGGNNEIKNDIVNHSKNIIDLIEEGDYVNGCEVMGIYVPRDIWEPIQINVDSQTIKYFIQDEIKSIVTKEQFESIEYKL